ncbi:nitrilase-related carbon-nitrogen hydrolase [Nocardia sp. Root136]|uniref:nitrilase-related carbon-nitrogen hydrolase n=1 Tax=Nocardia sp. Root136 TaxID=1736458 RepID=UPI0012E8CA07|nr:nitrilase-related carbon-nitrogen hydrolase [Nocardia sp. Root136]
MTSTEEAVREGFSGRIERRWLGPSTIWLVATIGSAVLWSIGTGLHPIPGIALLAPLPVLWLAPRQSASVVYAAAALSWFGGNARYWSYFIDTLDQPATIPVILLVGGALTFGACIALFRKLLIQGRFGWAVLALPALWTSVEFLVSMVGGIGAWWSIAYSQAEVAAIVRVASITGVWGISFLLLAVPSAVAALMAPGIRTARGLTVVGVAAGAVIVAIGAGQWCSEAASGGPVTRVGLVAVAQPPMYVPVATPDGARMITEAVAAVDQLADQGAEVIVFTEKAWHARQSELWLLRDPLSAVAARRGVHLVVGLELEQPNGTVNAAIAYPGETVYAKRFLVPGLESSLQPGTTSVRIPGRSWALAICFDLDRPALVRQNRTDGATLILAPALDFTVDHWLHSRMAVLRAAESGIAIARPAQLGELVAVDAQGAVQASVRTDLTETRMALADIRTAGDRTPYVRWGDWFAGLSIMLAVAGGLAALRRPVAQPRRPRESVDQS